MKKHNFVAIDVETAQSPYKKEIFICQIGIVVVRDLQIVERVEFLVQPKDNRYDRETSKVHGITSETTKDQPTFDVIWPKIEHYFYDTDIVAHNSSFDERVLRFNLEHFLGLKYDFEIKSKISKFIDTRYIFGMSVRLEDICPCIGMEYDEESHHDALYDAECCANLYIKYLQGEELSEEQRKNILERKETKKQKKTPRNNLKEDRLSGEVLEKDLTGADPNNPFYDRKVVITGEFPIKRKKLGQILKKMGADNNTVLSKKTNYILIGEKPGPSKMDYLEKLEKLKFDGYHIRKLYWKDIEQIFSGDWEGYHSEQNIEKKLNLTYEHYESKLARFENGYNIIASKELFYGKGFAGDFDLFNQITGNLGAFGDCDLYPNTQICVLSDDTVDNLFKGKKDETIEYIQNYYNNQKSVVFDYSFISESAILDFCKQRCESCGDEVTMELYEKYMESVFKKRQENKYVFKSGKNYCKVDGKIILKMEDGRTWCPSRQFRGNSYNIKDE